MDLLVVLLVLGAAAWLIAGPLRRSGREAAETVESADRAELEARKEAKYREIRDLELDHRTGKLSREDWRELDRRLRAEAIEILRELDELDETDAGPAAR